MKEWMTAAELAQLPVSASTLAELRMRKWPTTVQGVNKRASASGWTGRKAGSSQAWEYRTSSLPLQIQKAIATKALAVPSRPNPVQLSLDLPLAADLKDHQRHRMTARAALLQQIDELVLLRGISQGQAVNALVDLANGGNLAPELQKLVPIANARSNGARSLTRATVYNWLKARNQASGNIVALAPKDTPEAALPTWARTFFGLWADPRKPALTVVLEDLWPADQPAPSYDQARRLLQKVTVLTRHQGRVGPRDLKKFKAYVARDTSELWPGAVFCGDGHTFKAEVQHPIHGRPFRPEVTIIVDVYTRRVVGWSVDLAENTRSVADALRDAVTKTTCCDIFYYDNGAGAKNVVWDDPSIGLAARLSITKEHSRAYNSQARGVVERRNSTILHRAAQKFPSYVGQHMDREARQSGYKKTRRDVKAIGTSPLLPTWSQFVMFLEKEIEDSNNRPCDGLPEIVDKLTLKRRRMSPNEMWAAAEADGWVADPVPAHEAIDLFRPAEMRKARRGLVDLFGNEYFGGAPLEALHGEMVRVTYDIHDASKVWVRDQKGRFICEAIWGGHKQSFFPVAKAQLARENRVAGKLRRLEAHIETARAELGPALLEHALDRNFTQEQLDAAAKVIEFSTATRQVDSPVLTDGRPTFADDVSWAKWLLANPTEITSEDRQLLRLQLRNSSFLTLLDWEGVSAKTLGRLTNLEVEVA